MLNQGYLGDLRIGKTLRFAFTTDVGGVPTALAGATISAYKDGSLTQSTTGVTLSASHDGVTGLNQVVIDTSADGTFYSALSDFMLVITAGTVGGQSIAGNVVGQFSLENRSALIPTTADRKLVVDAAGLADANTVKVGPSGSGTAQTAGDIYAKVTNLPSDPADASDIAASHASLSSKIDTVDTVVDAIKVQTDNLPSDPADASVVAGLIAAVPAAVLVAATASPIAADIQEVNGTTVIGDGASTPWGPA